MRYVRLTKENWDNNLKNLLLSSAIFAPMKNASGLDYELLRPKDIPSVIYNLPKPTTPLKNFFLPVREDVSIFNGKSRPVILLGTPNCDIEALSLTDEIYLDNEYADPFYKKRREDTILISADCFSIAENCHCMTYDIKPYSFKKGDLALVNHNDTIMLRIISQKGEDFVRKLTGATDIDDEEMISFIEKKHYSIESLLLSVNKDLPGSDMTEMIVHKASEEIWKKYSSTCVSCGACTTICPTCTCFLLIDKPGFARIKQTDACQYPGFERVAGGEDGLFELHTRFRNRYMCKYVWKPQRFNAPACTGCGRCIDACIGKINKNDLFRELA